MDKTLLPNGLYDLLPPEAETARETVAGFLRHFAGFGYDEVSPPLLEFEDSLLKGQEDTLGAQTFRVMDPSSQRMMGFRPDITMQVGRVALLRLGKAPRPLRLCYAGPTLRVAPEALENTRQPLQVGLEIIGAGSAQADAEVIAVAASAMAQAGFASVTVDLNLPGLLPLLLEGDTQAAARGKEVRDAVAAKDIGLLERLGLREGARIAALLRAAGPVDTALAKMRALLAAPETAAELENLEQVVRLLTSMKLAITLDPLEQHGFAYHRGIRFSLFVPGLRTEAARGGRYRIAVEGKEEEATGCTLYADRLLAVLPAREAREKIYVPRGTGFAETEKLRSEGFATLFGMEDDAGAEARRLGCAKQWKQGKLAKV